MANLILQIYDNADDDNYSYNSIYKRFKIEKKEGIEEDYNKSHKEYIDAINRCIYESINNTELFKDDLIRKIYNGIGLTDDEKKSAETFLRNLKTKNNIFPVLTIDFLDKINKAFGRYINNKSYKNLKNDHYEKIKENLNKHIDRTKTHKLSTDKIKYLLFNFAEHIITNSSIETTKNVLEKISEINKDKLVYKYHMVTTNTKYTNINGKTLSKLEFNNIVDFLFELFKFEKPAKEIQKKSKKDFCDSVFDYLYDQLIKKIKYTSRNNTPEMSSQWNILIDILNIATVDYFDKEYIYLAPKTTVKTGGIDKNDIVPYIIEINKAPDDKDNANIWHQKEHAYKKLNINHAVSKYNFGKLVDFIGKDSSKTYDNAPPEIRKTWDAIINHINNKIHNIGNFAGVEDDDFLDDIDKKEWTSPESNLDKRRDIKQTRQAIGKTASTSESHIMTDQKKMHETDKIDLSFLYMYFTNFTAYTENNNKSERDRIIKDEILDNKTKIIEHIKKLKSHHYNVKYHNEFIGTIENHTDLKITATDDKLKELFKNHKIYDDINNYNDNDIITVYGIDAKIVDDNNITNLVTKICDFDYYKDLYKYPFKTLYIKKVNNDDLEISNIKLISPEYVK